MNLDPTDWGYDPCELNEFRFSAIRTLTEYCQNPQRLCFQCSVNDTCKCMYIHDTLNKCGIKHDVFMKLRDWASTYYQYNPRS